MKTSSFVLGLSLAANVVLLAAIVPRVLQREPESAASTVPAAVPSTPPPATAAELWAEIHRGDLRSQAEKLKADGFPPELIRAIVTAQVRAQFAARRKELEAAVRDQPFWKNPSPDARTQAALRDLWKDEQKIVKDLLGEDPENGLGASLRRQFPGFSTHTIEQVAGIRERYDQQRSEIYANLRGIGGLLPEEYAKVDALEKAMYSEIAAVLTPQELEEYDLRTSGTANQLRHTLVAFNPTEQEFRALFKIQRPFDEQYRLMRGLSSEEQMRARSEAQRQLNEQIQAALGAHRYAEYQRANDFHYRQTTQLVARLQLPPDTAEKLYAVQKEFEQRRNDLYRSSTATGGATAVREQAEALQQEAIARVTPILGGGSRVDAYKEYGGAWITSMVPRSPPRPAPKS